MKNLFLIACIFPTILIGQNLEDAYDDHEGESIYASTPIAGYYGGEYQVFLDKLYWMMDEKYADAAKSLSINVVSFPFIPEAIDSDDTTTETTLHTLTNRVFDVHQMESNSIVGISQIGTTLSYSGYGWQYGNLNIFSRINPVIFDVDDPYMCVGDLGLVSVGFVDNIIPTSQAHYDDCWFPHTILKHTLYFYCGESITDQVIDSISWIYDNTRGTMNEYPFEENGNDGLPLNSKTIDVCFRPTLMDGWIWYDPETTQSNSSLYDSGLPNSTGSVNYFPTEEVLDNWDICNGEDEYPLYYNPETPGGVFDQNKTTSFYNVGYVHPPVFALIDSPLLNVDGTVWAGYESNSGVTPMSGVPHTYEINNSIDLRQINPREKIIYNPSYVKINEDLTFPSHYKFITLHGKYPDKEQEVFNYFNNYWMYYWSGTVNFCNDRDILTPIEPTTNNEWRSYYKIKEGRTLTIKPCVIIMNAYFLGESSVNKSKIAYDPNQHLGNWDYDPTTIQIIPQDYTGPGSIACHWDCPPEKMYPISEDNMSDPDDNVITDLVKITNKESNVVNFEINVAREGNLKLVIYNSYGVLIEEIINPACNYMFNGTGLSSGLYVAQVSLDNEVLEVEKFYLIE